ARTRRARPGRRGDARRCAAQLPVGARHTGSGFSAFPASHAVRSAPAQEGSRVPLGLCPSPARGGEYEKACAAKRARPRRRVAGELDSMLLNPPATRRGPRAAPVAFSLTVHLTVLAAVAFGPRPAKRESAYQREIAPNEKKLVWYHFRDKLPDVS